jgi:outer membrane immunogenic protein
MGVADLTQHMKADCIILFLEVDGHPLAYLELLLGETYMKKLLIAAAGIMALGLSAPAGAADLAARPYTKAPPMPIAEVYNWTGFYIGGHIGYGWEHTNSDSFTPAGALTSTTSDPSGVFGGGQIGYNWQFSPNWLLGVEADASGSDLHQTTTTCSATGCASAAHQLDDFGTVRGRLGYVINNALLYGTGGWAWGHSNTDRTVTCVVAGGGVCPGGPSPSPLTGAVSSASGMESGWVAGAGVEWMFAPHWTAKIEYQHMEFDNIVRDFAYAGFPTAARHTVSDSTVDTVRVGVNYIFGGPAISRY